MFSKETYIPIIKWKRGERGAFEELDPKILEKIIPLIEVQPIPYDHAKKDFKKTIDQHLENFGEDLLSFWDIEKPVFIDAYTIYADTRISKTLNMASGKSILEFIVDDIESAGIAAIPITKLSRPSQFNALIINCIKNYHRGIGIRIEPQELIDIAGLESTLNDFINSLDIGKNEVDIFIDLREIKYGKDSKGNITFAKQTLNSYVSTLLDYINKFPFLNEWRNFTILGTSISENFSKIPSSTNETLPRVEWIIYKNLLTKQLSRIPLFGDYTISSPEWFDFDSRFMQVTANIKYTVEDKYLIFKGRSTRSDGFSQIYGLCHSLITHPEYCGRHYSSGDEFIYQCGTRIRKSTGNHETWIKNWVNHHLTITTNCLSHIHASVIS